MACSCSSTSFKSFTAAAPSSSSSSRSSSPASVSFLHHHQQQHHIPYLSCGSKHALLRWDCEKNTKQAHFHFSVAAKQGQGHYDKAKNTSQRGGGRGAGVAVKEDKTNRKGGNSGGKNPRPNNSNPNPRSYDNNSSPRSYNSSSSNRSGGRLSVVTVEVEDEDEDEDEDDDGSRGNPRSYNRSSDNNRNSKSYNTGKGGSRQPVLRDEEEEEDDEDDSDFDDEDDAEGSFASDANAELAIMPIPPAGFVLADDGSVSLMAPPHKRVTALVDSETKLSLDCLIRRVFSSSDGRQCFLLCPLDTPVQILRIEDGEVLKEISDEELEDIFPTASYELAKRRLHLVHSGFCLTLRGGFCYSEDDVIDLNTVYGGESGDSSLNEGVEVANFLWNGSEYLIFTPVDPLMFVSYRDNKTGELLIADDDLLDDEAVLDAIDEEKEFQAYMEEDSIMDDSATEDEEEEE